MRMLAALLLLTGCTTVDVVRVPGRERGGVFVTQEDLREPYVSLGPIQATRRGMLFFGLVDPAGTDLQSALDESLLPEVRRLGGDGVINVRFHQTQYAAPTRVLFALLFFVPLPTEVTVTGEVVRLARRADGP